MARAQQQVVRPQVERLEDRRVCNAGFNFTMDGRLEIRELRDVRITQAGSQYTVRFQGARIPDLKFNAGQVHSKQVWYHGSAHGDYVYNDTDLQLIAYGNGGSDMLVGGSRTDYLDGGAQADSLYGRGGIDILQGGVRDGVRDYLSGGSDADYFAVEWYYYGGRWYNRDNPVDFFGAGGDRFFQ